MKACSDRLENSKRGMPDSRSDHAPITAIVDIDCMTTIAILPELPSPERDGFFFRWARSKSPPPTARTK